MPAACPALVLFKDYFCDYLLVQEHPLENLATHHVAFTKTFLGGSGVIWSRYLITFLVSIKRRKPIKLIKAGTVQGGLNTWHACEPYTNKPLGRSSLGTLCNHKTCLAPFFFGVNWDSLSNEGSVVHTH